MLTGDSSPLQAMAATDFSTKGEAFVESRFLTPLLMCLGYETHKDYEVRRHGDEGTSFKLHYPPVEMGATRVKHYNPDYMPTIRKKMFWIIEAKSPRHVGFPFASSFVIQGLQYCIHPEIQANYLLLTNGENSAVYDAHASVFLGSDPYTPILTFRSIDIVTRWKEIFDLLSAEKVRARVERDLKAMYDKLSLSSLDKDYPQRLLRQIGAAAGDHSRAIERHVMKLYVERDDAQTEAWRHELENFSADQVFGLMDAPLGAGMKNEGTYFVDKQLAASIAPDAILMRLTSDFDRQSIFRKEQTFLAACFLHKRIRDPSTRAAIQVFLDTHAEADLPVLNQVECTFMRITRKQWVISLYPSLREKIQQAMEVAPELVRFVRPPTALEMSYSAELEIHDLTFGKLRTIPEGTLTKWLPVLLKMEEQLEEPFRVARAQLREDERQIGGLENYGMGGKHYAFRNIVLNSSLDVDHAA